MDRESGVRGLGDCKAETERMGALKLSGQCE